MHTLDQKNSPVATNSEVVLEPQGSDADKPAVKVSVVRVRTPKVGVAALSARCM